MSRIWNLKLPQSLPLLAASLTTLCFDYCMFGDEADISLIGKLINLEMLSLRDVISCLKKLEEWYVNDHERLFNQLQASCRPFILHAHAEEDGVTILLRSTMLSKYIPTILQLQSLERLEACYCDSMLYVFDFEGFVIAKGETIKFLSSLQNLCLMGLPEMMQIWKGDAKLFNLCNLRWILLQDCSKLRQVFPPALQQSLSSLEQVVISSCDSLEEIFGKEEEEDHHQENEIVELKIEHTTTSPSFGKLTFIHISDCHPSIVKGLVQLSKLEVELCRTMEK
ncbi:hypothetical protein LWI29_036456 [Acer saccharum]|uniref:Disease resistance protein At4g27190-like leucine-rich repeats domain-containing protein n=1 Tax=Acer saccharum TaxID=4024 RepID=A0AA39SEP1_ACESA|nr:hypothetical protein LWI29_036456 [Acer saccharum]